MPPYRPARLLLTAATLAVILAGTNGCRRGPEGTSRVVVIGEEAPTLGDPLRPPATMADATLRQSVAQGLVRFDPAGQIEPGLAERWNVSDDGLSYIFRLSTGEWPDGRKIVARDVARLLTRQIKANAGSPTFDAVGAVSEIVAMTDRVIEIRLLAPRPNLLTLLAQPDFAIIREGEGTGPFHIREPKDAKPEKYPEISLRRRLPGLDGEEGERQDVTLLAMPATTAIRAFVAGEADVVLGGTFVDLPLANNARLPRNSLRFDPVAGLFGLAPARKDGIIADAAVRRLLSEALDRRALIAELAVPGLGPRSTLLQDGLDGIGTLPQPAWLDQPAAERRPALLAEAAARFPAEERPEGEVAEPRKIRVDLPEGPGGDIILRRLNADWGPLGLTVERAGDNRADLRWVDSVAPSSSPAWFLRQFRCSVAPVCLPEMDELLAQARAVPIAVQRAALFGEVARSMDAEQLFIPVAAPIRWSLVARSAPGFIENRYGRHTLGGLGASPRPGDG
ncbi:ABC transporter substrate-binding protein [Sphingomonas rhizophila]|uniref:ABC transporter substrate-binding protein n=1 Tax=Sphingomonas rhizophila TaxID=2071607 RepID=A0A7G9S8S3_9SPHN|nr:ABC transporter substrate-binding protein [Sphingomonas rhizophila]QNN64248.1 ABC transporter substrate-binding protein [Sphingomonas rhizophila]